MNVRQTLEAIPQIQAHHHGTMLHQFVTEHRQLFVTVASHMGCRHVLQHHNPHFKPHLQPCDWSDAM
jgi:hypothetical protein